MPILHIHGKLGELPDFTQKNARMYNPNMDSRSLKVSADSIRIVHEDVKGKEILLQAKNLIREAEIVCFLGFGYHPSNLDRLGIGPATKWRSKLVFGSIYGKTDEEERQIRKQIGGGGTVLLLKHDCLGLLRNQPIFP